MPWHAETNLPGFSLLTPPPAEPCLLDVWKGRRRERRKRGEGPWKDPVSRSGMALTWSWMAHPRLFPTTQQVPCTVRRPPHIPTRRRSTAGMFAYAERCAVLFSPFFGWRLVSYSLSVPPSGSCHRPGEHVGGRRDHARQLSPSSGHGNQGIAMAAVPHVKHHHHGSSVSSCKVLQTLTRDASSLLELDPRFIDAGFEVGDTSSVPDRLASTNQPTSRDIDSE